MRTDLATHEWIVAISEEAKDKQYLDMVNQSEGDFVPPICKTFGVWTLCVLSTLFLIADRCTVVSSFMTAGSWYWMPAGLQIL